MQPRNLSTRRQFLKSSLAATALAATLPGVSQAAKPKKPKTLYEISLAQWSLHRMLRNGGLDNLDFASFTKEKCGISAVEYVNQFFKDKANDEKYLGQMKQRAADAGVKSLLIMIDGEGNLGDPDSGKRTTAIENHYKWIGAAKFLGCHSIRVNARSGGEYDEQLKLAADGLRRLSEYAQANGGLNVIVENHGGLSSNGEWLSTVIKNVNLPNCGTLPDFGNFRLGGGKDYDKYQGVKELMPFAKAVSAKSYDFDESGQEKTIDYKRMMQIVLDAGYHGYVGIEYEGGRLGELEGVVATRKLLEQVRKELASK